MRRKLLVGNWKMNMSMSATKSFFADLQNNLNKDGSDPSNIDLAVGAPFTLLSTVGTEKPNYMASAAQNVHWETEGAFTGEVSGAMLKEAGVEYVIIGHSERRQFFGETDETVTKRTKAALACGLKPIVCVGELLEERKSNKTMDVVRAQMKAVINDVEPNDNIVIAYEPVWAIGTGLAATSQQAEEVHAFIRELLGEVYGPEFAEKIRILYGGSMKPSNIAELLTKQNIDGGLVGGASLKALDFSQMIAITAK